MTTITVDIYDEQEAYWEALAQSMRSAGPCPTCGGSGYIKAADPRDYVEECMDCAVVNPEIQAALVMHQDLQDALVDTMRQHEYDDSNEPAIDCTGDPMDGREADREQEQADHWEYTNAENADRDDTSLREGTDMTKARTLKIRYTQIHTDPWNEFDETQGVPPVGARVYVIERCLLAGAAGYQRDGNNISYQFRITPGRTNSSREERVTGWLGTTDNIDRYTLGQYEVVGGSSTHLHLRALNG